MNKLSKKFILTIVAILLTVVALGNSIYAWFALSNTNIVGEFQLDVRADAGLEISLDGVNWYSELSPEQISNEIGNLLDLKSITSTNGKDFKKVDDTLKNELISTDEDDINTSFISIQMWFRTTNPIDDVDYSIFLANKNDDATYQIGGDGTWIASKGIQWTPDVEFENEEDVLGTTDTYYASECVRMSFVNLNVLNEFETGHSGVMKLGTADTYGKIFDLTKNADRGYNYDFGQIKYYLAKKGFTHEEIIEADEAPTVVRNLSTYDNNGNAQNNNSEIVKLTHLSGETLSGVSYESIGAVQLNIWLEGWDADCFDAVLKDSIKIQLAFRLSKVLE